MSHSLKVKDWITWPLIRAHLCTLAVAVGFNSSWRAPRYAFRYGGLQYGLAFTVAMATVALPVVLLQLAVGQLSQQDAVGVWRAVPFFRGVGYIRLLISFLGSVYSLIYVALTITYFLYTIGHTIPFEECVPTEVLTEDDSESLSNASRCLDETFMAPVSSKPEYYLAVALIVIFLWAVLPFMLMGLVYAALIIPMFSPYLRSSFGDTIFSFYNPVKLMKRLFYALGPAVLILAIVTVSCIGDAANLALIVERGNWRAFMAPEVWHGAVSQALLSSQIAGGYLISAGDTVYASTNVQWTTLAFIGANIATTWGGLLFWYAISGPNKDTGMIAVLLEAYKLGEELDIAWSLVVKSTLFLSGLISMLFFAYPVFDRCRRVGGMRWRVLSTSGSVVAAGVTLAVLAGRLPALELLEDVAVPLLISLATVLEILAFVFIYGWKVLVEDVEFLSGRSLCKSWVLGWCAAPGIIAPLTAWWVTTVVLQGDWLQPPWTAITGVATMLVAFIIFAVFAVVATAKQVQYDCIGETHLPQKVKSSFQPSRHWGPRDPITHYYWLARRDEVDRTNLLRARYHRRELGQLSGRPSFLNINTISESDASVNIDKKRSNSDDWLYTVYRKHVIRGFRKHIEMTRQRAKSLDWRYTNKCLNADLKKIDMSSLNKSETMM